ncbi:hypothetical protein CHU_1405 [Cytophaga hutchinsonii ATCC 33406]|uniref:Uncharacterized protein n=2 Tax=Cytophaga hutchinsonii TaxID=985 RepID=A0A6N4SQQ7_CYTH3|nr:hypothetical protein CHU_1405 [Cytophaga hutchinsonii ATCC 33406]
MHLNHTTMNKLFLAVIIAVIFSGCNTYQNNSTYIIAPGETVDIYYSTNSCCFYCLINEDQLKHIRLVDQKTLDPGPDQCEGCNATFAFTFKAGSIGTDTVKLKHLNALDTCTYPGGVTENYIITVRE